MAQKKNERRGLGRGLSALMADVNIEPTADEQKSTPKPERTLPVERLEPNPDQPRRLFDEDALQSLADSIREKGVIQPLIVRPSPRSENAFEIVAGERRWRASQIAQVHEVPVIIRELDDTEVLEVAIIENIQRADLNPIEEALGYRQLMDRFGHTQEKVSSALSKSRSYIANLLRLLQLPDDVQEMLRDGALSIGHARALITAPNASELAKHVVAKGLSVRETEKLVKTGTPKAAKKRLKPEKDADTRALEGDLYANLGMKVVIDHVPDKENGKVVIQYKSLEDLDELCRLLTSTR
ncbi:MULTISPECIES: ParB/RepB/Spo0J family partition protein [Halocynthiibacter]|uniref:ParB/RepB/Spo0J family partition protein n=1 Tax=Halocynthiibacter halioticoli TaxID=2986804 RepID=A0AAE3J098_9RHOB|nr:MULTISPECIES: ParB/RepB/Spo0J family partition protein [Halocynthiibacter]MCV6825607.1 ParB/RepB/Spo0J family partition protein [Halocynthiibacter halioticoli]MCW4058608.1 ParB/RepB/Spo0J family partition protein [Halocynthiibacter sp. SDUM655004]